MLGQVWNYATRETAKLQRLATIRIYSSLCKSWDHGMFAKPSPNMRKTVWHGLKNKTHFCVRFVYFWTIELASGKSPRAFSNARNISLYIVNDGREITRSRALGISTFIVDVPLETQKQSPSNATICALQRKFKRNQNVMESPVDQT